MKLYVIRMTKPPPLNVYGMGEQEKGVYVVASSLTIALDRAKLLNGGWDITSAALYLNFPIIVDPSSFKECCGG